MKQAQLVNRTEYSSVLVIILCKYPNYLLLSFPKQNTHSDQRSKPSN